MNMAKKVPIVQATFYNNNTKQIENCYPMTSAKGVVMSDGKTLEESFSDKANDTNVVHKSGDEEILGQKTFDDLRANGLHLSDEGDWNRWVRAFYFFLKEQGVIQFGTEEDWSVILRNIADPEYDYDAATKGYVDTKISSTEETLVHKDGFERITGRKQFQNGISVGLFNSLVANEDGVQSGAWLDQEDNPAPFIVADPSADDHAATKLYVDGGLATKANLQHQHTVADITDFPELYYDATAFFTSGAYPSDKYGELLEAVKAKKTVYATIDEAGYASYIFFISSANSDGSSSRVLLTTIFADGGNLYLNMFVVQQSGMTSLQENITGKADKATTLAGYGIGDAYTKSEVDTALEGKQDTLTPGNGISIEGNVIGVTEEISSKQDAISDLETIRSNAQNASDIVINLENDRKYTHNLANVRIKSLSVDEPIKVCDVPMVLIGSGAPSAANVPMNWDKVKMGEWFGIPNFIGQMYVNISASNNALYVAVNDTAVIGWKTA